MALNELKEEMLKPVDRILQYVMSIITDRVAREYLAENMQLHAENERLRLQLEARDGQDE